MVFIDEDFIQHKSCERKKQRNNCKHVARDDLDEGMKKCEGDDHKDHKEC